MLSWAEQRERTIRGEMLDGFLKCANMTHNFVLKGDTCIMRHYGGRACWRLVEAKYGLPYRVTDTVEFDARSVMSLTPYVEKFCSQGEDRTFKVLKDTKLEQRYAIYYTINVYSYQPKKASLRISVSRQGCDKTCVDTQHGQLVYTIEHLCDMACNSLLMRNDIRDLYDILFIYQYYQKDLNPIFIQRIRLVLTAKNSKPDAIYNIIKNKQSEGIDNELLEKAYLYICRELDINAMWHESDGEVQSGKG